MSQARQLPLIEAPVALAELASDPGADYGEVFTRRWIVDLILDLIGYTPEKDLGAQAMVEPSCGTGAFLVPVVQRLIASSESHGRDLGFLHSAIRAARAASFRPSPEPVGSRGQDAAVRMAGLEVSRRSVLRSQMLARFAGRP